MEAVALPVSVNQIEKKKMSPNVSLCRARCQAHLPPHVSCPHKRRVWPATTVEFDGARSAAVELGGGWICLPRSSSWPLAAVELGGARSTTVDSVVPDPPPSSSVELDPPPRELGDGKICLPCSYGFGRCCHSSLGEGEGETPPPLRLGRGRGAPVATIRERERHCRHCGGGTPRPTCHYGGEGH